MTEAFPHASSAPLPHTAPRPRHLPFALQTSGACRHNSKCLDDTSLFPTSAVIMEFWDDKAEPSILLAVKSACEAVRGNLVNGSSDSR